MHTLEPQFIQSVFEQFKESTLHGRWITLDHIEKTFHQYDKYEQIGDSEHHRPIYQFEFVREKRRY